MRPLALAILVALLAATTAHAEPVTLGSFAFDSRLFGDTMTPAVPAPLPVPQLWLNVANVTPAPGTYLVGPTFNTGLQLGAGGLFAIGYSSPIINGPGADLGIITAPNRTPGEPVANFLIINNSVAVPYDPLRAGVDTGVTRDYFLQGQPTGPFRFSLFVTPVELSDFGIAEGESIQSVRIGSTNGGVLGGPNLATIRVAGFERGDAVAVPEPVLLRRLMPRKHLFGPELNAALNPGLQRATAWAAAKLLGASSRGVYVILPTVVLEVQEWCSGLYSMKWLLLLAVFIALVSPMRATSKFGLILVAPLIAFEANVFRVVAIGVGLETLGHVPKEWMGWGAIGFGAMQIVGLGWLAARRRSETGIRPTIIAI